MNLLFLPVQAVVMARVPVMKQREFVLRVEVVVLVDVVEETQNSLGERPFDLEIVKIRY